MRKISRKHLSVRSVQVALYVHTLQLVVKVFETAPAYSRTVKSAVAVAKKVNKSCIEQLKQLAGEKLVKKLPDPIYSYASSKGALNYYIGGVRVGVAQWKHYSIETLLKPFAHQTNVTSSEKITGVEGT